MTSTSPHDSVTRSGYAWRTAPEESVRADLRRLRELNPLTHCITNVVAAGFTANVLLALGASPAMVTAAEEVADFAAAADGLLINVGTVTSADVAAMTTAARSAQSATTPWVLDPVAVGRLRYRTELVDDLLRYRPTVIRGNASEILSLAGAAGGGKGPDSTADSSEAISSARALAQRTRAVVAVSGAVDYVTDGDDVFEVAGGHVLLTKISGTGCALGAAMAAFLAASDTPLNAAVSASAVFAAAAELAAEQAQGPGAMATALLDSLHLLGQAPFPRRPPTSR